MQQSSHAHPARIEWLDMLRGAAMICVIFGHPANVPDDIKQWIYSFHMPLFFMISGATFRYSRYSSLKQCLLDQAKKLLIPYVSFYILCIPFWYLNWRVLGDSDTSIVELIAGLPVANSDLVTMSNGALWFLPTLFLTAVLFWLLNDWDSKGRCKLAGTIPLCFLVGMALASATGIALPWGLHCVPMTVTFYYIGFIAMTHYRNRVAAPTQDQQILFAIADLSIGTWAAFTNDSMGIQANEYHTMALALASSLFISLGLALVLIGLPAVKPLVFIGQHTLTMLGLHIPLMRFLENLSATARLGDNHPLWIAAIVLVVLLPITYCVDRYLPFLTGRSKQ